MMDSRRLAYLEAMGIDVWQHRRASVDQEPDAAHPRIVMGTGDGDILCVVESGSGAQLELAANIGGAMRSPPVWSWPAGQSDDADDAVASVTIEEAVTENMLTRVLVFGEDLAAALLGPEIPAVISTARVHVVPALDELARDAGAKRLLWRLMNENGIAAGRPGDR